MTFGNSKLIISQENILSVIPQRPPFVMIDQLVGCDEIRSQTTFLIRKDNVLVTNNQLTEAGLLENIAQTAAAGVGYIARQLNKPVLTGYIGAVKNLEIFALPNVGDVVETEVVIENQVFDITIITGTATCNGIPAAKCEMKIFIKK